MKRILLSLFVAMSGLAFTACSDDNNDGLQQEASLPGIFIEATLDESGTSAHISFAIDDHAAGYKYAVGRRSDRDSFMDGTMEGIVEIDDTENLSVDVEDLRMGQEYVVFAYAFDAENRHGALAMAAFETPAAAEGAFHIELSYVTDVSAAFTIICPDIYYMYEYALGTPDDRKSFDNGSMKGIEEKIEESGFTLSFFNLEPETEYTLFARAKHRADFTTGTQEMTITTYAADGAFPDVEFSIGYRDSYCGEYIFTPNEHCGGVTVLICPRYSFDKYIYNSIYGNGDLLYFLDEWYAIAESGALPGLQMHRSMSGALNATYYNYPDPFASDYPTEAYVLSYDKDKKPAGVKYYAFTNYEYDQSAGAAAVNMNIDEITSSGAVATITPNEYTMGVFFDTFTETAYQEAVDSGNTDQYLQDYFLTAGYNWWYFGQGSAPLIFTEDLGEPSTKYYLVVCPMNPNGSLGWGATSVLEYTSLP